MAYLAQEPDRLDQPEAAGEQPTTGIADLRAERRQLTVVFIDLVESTPLSERIDPEDFFAVIRSYRDICDEQIRHYGGHIARMIGDGLLAYFGVPQAHENDPERAVRAALAIVGAMQEREFGVSDRSVARLKVRVAVNTGLVVVGSVPGEPSERVEVFGSPANIAARLQGLAGENEVVIGAGTHELIRGIFACTPLGAQRLKGVEGPVAAWRVDALAPGASRFDRARIAPLAPMIGRGEQLALLQALWRDSSAGSGRVGVISGEPGIGKSRLVREFRSSLDPEIEVLLLQCSPFHTNTPLAPEVDRLRRATGILATDDPRLSISRLRALLGRAVRDVDQALPYYGALLSIPAFPGYEPADLGSLAERQRIFQVMTDALIAASRKRPVLVIVEDVQWVDPTSTDIFAHIVARCTHERVLILLTHRDDYQPGWLPADTATPIPLHKLPAQDCEQVVVALAGARTVQARTVREIVSRTDGVPLFIEEVTRAVIDADAAEPAPDRPRDKMSELPVPTTLQDSLMERLDRLGAAKRVAQIASVFGRRFEEHGIASVLANDAISLRHPLEALERAGIVYRTGESQRPLFAFKHAMIQEVAYASLLKEERRELHGRVAEWLVQRAALGEHQPSVLGYHYARAGDFAAAVDAWLEAGKSAIRRSATKEAVAHLREGISLLSKLVPSPRRNELEIALQANLAMAYTAIAGWSDPNVYGPYDRAMQLCASYGSVREKTAVLFGMSVAKLVNCELTKVLEHAEDFVRRAEQWRNDEAILLAYTAALVANFFNGRLKQARHYADLITGRYNPAQHRKIVHIYQHDPLVVALVYSGHIEWLLGRPSVARACCEDARRVAENVGHPFMIAFAHVLGVSDHWYEGDLAANLACVERGLKVAADYGYPVYQVIGPLWAASALAARGPAAMVLDKLDKVITTRLPPEDHCIQMPLYKALLGAEFGRIGQTERALAMITSAEALMQRTGERWAAPEIYRIHAELLCSGPGRDQAAGMQLYRRSLDCARELEAVGWQLRTTIGLARLLRDGGEPSEAHAMLAEVRSRFPRSETSSDLRQADQLLHELDPAPPAPAQLLP